MSQENVELVRSIHEAWERGDYTSTEWADPSSNGWSLTALNLAVARG